MNRALKYSLLAIGVVLGVTAALFVYLALTFDPNAYKPQLERLVREHTGRVLTVEGEIGLAFFPRMGLELGRTRLSEADGKADFVVVNEVRVALALVPLLSKRVVVDEVVIDGLDAQIVKRADGTLNIDDLMRAGSASAPKEAPPAPEGGPALALDVEGVRLSNAALTYRDEAGGSQYRVSGLALQTGRFAPALPMPFTLESRIDANQPALALALRAKGELSADLEQQRFRVSGLQVNVDGNAAGVQLAKTELALPALELNSASRAIRLEGLVASVMARQASDNIEIRLTAPAISLSNEHAEGAGAQLTFKLQGPQRAANGTVSLSALAGTRRALKVSELAVRLDASQAGSSVRGRLATPLEADLEVLAFGLPGIAGKFDVNTPALPQPAVLSMSGTARAVLSEEKAEVNLSGQLDDSDFQGRLKLAKFDPPHITFDFTMDKLDTDRYITKPAAEPSAQPAAGTTQDTPLDLSALKTLHLDGRVRVGQLKIAGVTASQVRADIKAANGQLRVEPLSADLYEGTLRGSVGIDAHRSRFTVKQSLANVQVGPLLHDALAQDLLAGRGDVAIDAVASGNTVNELKRSLSGQTKLTLQNGAIRGINLTNALRKAKNLFSSGQDTASEAAKGEETEFSEFVASFALQGGKARNDDLSVKSPFLRLAGSGEIDLMQLVLDYRARASVVATSKGQGGRDLDELAGLTVPVHITGPLTAPKFKLEMRNVLRAGAETKLEEKKEALKEKLKGRLQERLGEPETPPADGAPEPPPPENREEQVKRKLKDLLR